MEEIKLENNKYPIRLKEIKKPPKKIYLDGNSKVLNDFSIAVIGSRNCTEYGRKMCEMIVKDLVKYNITIISGLADGIDSIAHKTCIENGGKTIAVLPSGLKNIYPISNKKLFEEIKNSSGTIISEYEPYEKKEPNKCLERNRIVAGIANATLVIEAGKISGTSVTARITKEQGKNVFCIPSSLENPKGIGTNELIKKGAKLVTSVKDIIKEYQNIENFKINNSNRKNTRKSNFKEKDNIINEEYRDVYEILDYKPKHINEIIKILKKPIDEITYKLTMLELEDSIIEISGKRFVKK